MLNMLLQLCSMIEIEVEMDSDVLVAEAATGAVSSLLHRINAYSIYLKYFAFVFLLVPGGYLFFSRVGGYVIISIMVSGKNIRTN